MAPEYNLSIQARIPVALCAIHNFIAEYDASERALDKSITTANDCYDYYEGINFAGAGQEEDRDASFKHDQIAESMWQSYQRVCAEMGEDLDESLDDDDDDDNGSDGN